MSRPFPFGKRKWWRDVVEPPPASPPAPEPPPVPTQDAYDAAKHDTATYSS